MTTICGKAVCILLFAGIVPVAPGEDEAIDSRAYSVIAQAADSVRRFENWEVESERIEQVIDRIWEENGWKSDSDRFVQELMIDVSSVPPWDYFTKMQVATDRVAERYDLSPLESMRFRTALIREVGTFLGKNAQTVKEQSRVYFDVINDNGELTPEVVAKLAKDAEPLMDEMRERILGMAEGMRTVLSEESRELLDKDIKAHRNRMAYFQARWLAWSKGEWKPEEWGFEPSPDLPSDEWLDEFFSDRESERETQAASIILEEDEELDVPEYFPHDPATWYAYVLEFERSHRLDRCQVAAVRSIYYELIDRGFTLRRNHMDVLRKIPEELRSSDPIYAPIRATFNELKTRLHALLTRSQQAQNGS